MNNEEKILSLLENMNANMEAMQAEQQKTNDRLEDVEGRLEMVRSDMTDVKFLQFKIDKDVSTLKGNVSIIKREQSEMKSTLDAVFTQTANLTEFMTATEADIARLKASAQ